jgi:hypothetical protein
MKATIDTAPFVALPTTDEFILFPEDADGTIPLDPSNQQHLRSMSPFILALDPPSQGNYLVRGNGTPFRGAVYSAPALGSQVDYQSRLISPRIASFAQRPISTGPVTSEERQTQAGMVDRDQLISIALQHRQLKMTPPIVFLINPQSMAFTYTSKQNYGDVGRYGFIFYRWGEELVTIEISCRIGAFIAGRARSQTPNRFDNYNVDGVTGLQFASRRDSAGWRQLMNILALYRNSATIADTLGRSRAYHDVGKQSIYYDGQRWVGRLKSLSFSVGEDRSNGGIDFTMSFEVHQHFELAHEPKLSSLTPMHEPR